MRERIGAHEAVRAHIVCKIEAIRVSEGGVWMGAVWLRVSPGHGCVGVW